MPASTILKHLRDGKLTIKDGTTPAAVTLEIPFTLGDFKLDGLSADQREVKRYKVRGTLQTLRKGEDKQPTGSFSCALADYSDAASQTIYDFVRKEGSYTANLSTSSEMGDVYTVDLVWTVEGTDVGDPSDHIITCEDCDIEMALAEGEPNSASFSFTVNGTVTLT
jgi:hypothetical protein